MSKQCPLINHKVVYLECLECDLRKECESGTLQIQKDDLSNELYCLVVGSRSFTDMQYMRDVMFEVLSQYPKHRIIIVSGGANGADSLAKQYAMENGYTYKEFPADWNTYGKRAGYIRNEQMHQFISQYPDRVCVAFWDGNSKGTAQNFELAKQYNNKVILKLF